MKCEKCGYEMSSTPDTKKRIDIDSGGGKLKDITIGWWWSCSQCGYTTYQKRYSW